MHPNWNDMLNAEAHRQDLLAEAARLHRAQEIKAMLPARRPALYRFIGGFGRLLSGWGAQLERLEQHT